MAFTTYKLKTFAEQLIPKKYLRVVGLYALRATAPFYKGSAVKCPCCGYSAKKFASYGQHKRDNVLCRWCLSLERHRSLWLYIHEKTDWLSRPIKMLHFAPEHQFQALFSNQKNIDYLSADLDMPTAMVKMDITDIPMPDNTFDVIMCNHVLEHVPDDAKAMRELYRVLRPGGQAILQTPMSDAAKTIEDVNLTDPKERVERFGQEDHIRLYGLDKQTRLEAAGFTVVLDQFIKNLPTEVKAHYALMNEDIWLVKKPK